MFSLLSVALAIIILNIPFGCWRAATRKFSLPWFLAIHLPVPMVVLIRLSVGVEWHWHTAPVLLGSFFLGQALGHRLGRHWGWNEVKG